MDPTRIRNWALAITAILAVAGSMLAYGKKVIAQEARKEAAAQMAPAVQELGEIKNLLRRQEDRELFKMCMEYAHQEQAVEARNQTCTRESNQRWDVWAQQDAWDQCESVTPGECGPKPEA